MRGVRGGLRLPSLLLLLVPLLPPPPALSPAGASRRSGGSRSVSQVCVEKSLIFRSNTPYSTDIVSDPGGHDPLFCVRLDDSKLNYFQQPQDITESDLAEFLEKYSRHSFLAPSQVQPWFSAFYRAGDPILIYFDSSSVLSMLRQPVKMGASGLCVDGNPAGFLDSKSTSCTRIFANLSKSCMTDPALDAASYYRDFTVLKAPINDTIMQSMKVNVTAVSPPGAPHMKDNICTNVVSEVIYEIEYSSTSGIQSVSVQFKVSNISGNSRSSLQQHFTMHFWTRTLSHMLPRSGNPGYITGAPLLIANSGVMQHFLVLHCLDFYSALIGIRRNMSLSPILEDSIGDSNCSYMQQKLYKAFQGMNRTEDFAITGSAHSTQAEEWMTILIQNCSVQAVNCTSCCMVPVTLEIQILWTKVGLLSNPQAQILGARHFYYCHPLKVPEEVTNADGSIFGESRRKAVSQKECIQGMVERSSGQPGLVEGILAYHKRLELLNMSTVPVATVVTFTDMTDWPEPPRGQPQMHWKLPFDIFFPFKMIGKSASSDAKYSNGINKGQKYQSLLLINVFVAFAPLLYIATLLLHLITNFKN